MWKINWIGGLGVMLGTYFILESWHVMKRALAKERSTFIWSFLQSFINLIFTSYFYEHLSTMC